MKVLDDIPFAIRTEEVFSRLHLETRGAYAAEIHALVDRARQVARPRALYEVAFVQERGADSVVIADGNRDGEWLASEGAYGEADAAGRGGGGEAKPEKGRARFVSRVLRANLEEVERVFPYVATCGEELAAIPVADDDVFGQFCRDTIKEMALHAAISHLTSHLRECYSLENLVSMNPGSGDVSVWPIEQQRELFAFFGDMQERIGVTLSDSCVMIPNKSVSGLFFPSETGFQTCQLCHREKCPGRRAPFDPHLWEERLGGET